MHGTAWSIHARQCHVRLSKNVSKVRGAAIIKDFVTGTVAVEEGVDRCV